MTLGERVKQRRERRNWSQGHLARLTGLDQGILSRIESGEVRNPGINSLIALARALECSIDYLVDLYNEDQMDSSAMASVSA